MKPPSTVPAQKTRPLPRKHQLRQLDSPRTTPRVRTNKEILRRALQLTASGWSFSSNFAIISSKPREIAALSKSLGTGASARSGAFRILRACILASLCFIRNTSFCCSIKSAGVVDVDPCCSEASLGGCSLNMSFFSFNSSVMRDRKRAIADGETSKSRAFFNSSRRATSRRRTPHSVSPDC
jgi:hypothetical protein